MRRNLRYPLWKAQSFVSTREFPTVSITKHAFWNAAPSIGAILMIVGKPGPHKSEMPLLIGRFCLSLFIETSKFRMTSLSLLNTLTTNKSHWHGRNQAATWQPPLPPLFCRQIHHKSTIANHATVQQRQPNILATTQHHTTLTSPDMNYEVWFVIAFVWITCWGLASTSAIATLRWTAGKGRCAYLQTEGEACSEENQLWMNTIEPVYVHFHIIGHEIMCSSTWPNVERKANLQ